MNLPPNLTQLGTVAALRHLARKHDGITAPEEVIEWAVRRGYIRRIRTGTEQEETWALTPTGGQVVNIVWQHQAQRIERRRSN